MANHVSGRIRVPSNPLNIGIVGGGIAGLYAALLLQIHGYRVRVFEGTVRVGGRVYTHYFTQEQDQYFEAGAMRLPQSDFQQYTFDLINWVRQFEEAKIPLDRRAELIEYRLSDPGNRRYINGVKGDGASIMSTTPASIQWEVPSDYKNKSAKDLLGEAIGDFIKALQQDFEEGFKTLLKFDNYSFRYYLVDVMKWPTEVIDFVETVTSQTNQFALSVPEMVMQNMDFATEKWSTIKYGMNRLPAALSWLLGENNITYGARVTITANGNNGRIEATFDKVILAIPPAALKMIADRPRWGPDKEVAIRSIHFESLYKMGLRFKTRFWERVKPKPTYGGQSTTDLPIRWIVYPSNGINQDGPGVLLVYAWMTDATTWLPLSCTERRSLALFCLSRMYDGEEDSVTGVPVDVHDLLIGTADAVWSARTSTGDAMFLPGQWLSRFEPARRPEGDIFFAGEHLSHRHTWIAGACESAHKAVCDMIGEVPPLKPKPFFFRGHDQQPFGHGRLSPTAPPTEEELDHGAPLMLGSRGDDVTPKMPYQFTPREPLFKFERGWTKSNQNSAAAFPLHLGGDSGCTIGCEFSALSRPATAT